MTESNSFRFRTEFFNLTNTPQFGNPNTSLGYSDPTLLNPTASSSFGEITSEQGGPHPRIIQFAAEISVLIQREHAAVSHRSSLFRLPEKAIDDDD